MKEAFQGGNPIKLATIVSFLLSFLFLLLNTQVISTLEFRCVQQKSSINDF